MPSKLLAFQDHAWLRMEAPENLMIITGLMTFSKPIDCERLKIHLETSLLRFDRFGQRIVMPPLSTSKSNSKSSSSPLGRANPGCRKRSARS